MKFLNSITTLCIGAHPDDVEYGMAGTFSKCRDTDFVVLVMSEGGDWDKTTTYNDRKKENENMYLIIPILILSLVIGNSFKNRINKMDFFTFSKINYWSTFSKGQEDLIKKFIYFISSLYFGIILMTSVPFESILIFDPIPSMTSIDSVLSNSQGLA